MVVGSGFVVSDETTVFHHPAEGSLQDPTPGQDMETGKVVVTFDDLDC